MLRVAFGSIHTSDNVTYPTDMESGTIERMDKSLGKSLAACVPQIEVLPPAALESLRTWWGRARRVYPEATLKAWRCDWAVYRGFCEPRQLVPLPATPETVAGFVLYCKEAGKKPATVRRYLSTIARFHRAAQLFNPCASEAVQMKMKGMTNEVSVRQRRARGLGMAEIQAFLNSAGDNFQTLRERAMLCVAYDAMTRRSELIAIDVEDLEFLSDGTGRLLIRRSKTDQAGEGHVAYLSRQTVRHVQAWLKRAGIKDGPVFRRIIGRGTVTYTRQGKGRIGGRLSPEAVARAFKAVARYLNLPAEDVEGVSGHSVRVGATQDLLALNVDLASVMREGRWKSVRMPMRYGEHVMAARGGMARAAKEQGRDSQ
jgi:integrase